MRNLSRYQRRRIEFIFNELERGIERYPVDTAEAKQGLETERKFFEAWSNKGDYPSWLREVLPATITEDIAHHKDAIFFKKNGSTIGIQIKSSERRAEEHRRKYPKIPVVVVHYSDGPETIRKKTLDAIRRLNHV